MGVTLTTAVIGLTWLSMCNLPQPPVPPISGVTNTVQQAVQGAARYRTRCLNSGQATIQGERERHDSEATRRADEHSAFAAEHPTHSMQAPDTLYAVTQVCRVSRKLYLTMEVWNAVPAVGGYCTWKLQSQFTAQMTMDSTRSGPFNGYWPVPSVEHRGMSHRLPHFRITRRTG